MQCSGVIPFLCYLFRAAFSAAVNSVKRLQDDESSGEEEEYRAVRKRTSEQVSPCVCVCVCVCVCACADLVWILNTVYAEIFAGKIFSWVPLTNEIKSTNLYTMKIIGSTKIVHTTVYT